MWFLEHIHYWSYIFLFLLGLYAIIVSSNLVRKIIGLSIMQTAVILFFISLGTKRGATVPVLYDHSPVPIDPNQVANPLPHALMLTAIVVAVSTLGVGLGLIISIYRSWRTMEERELVEKLEGSR